MTPSGLILAFHGCESELAKRVILGEDQLIPSENGHDWLGEGIYFWAHDPMRALEWAKDHLPMPKSKPAAVGAVIDLGHCLNLAERACVEWVSTAHSHLRALLEKSGQLDLMPVNQGGSRILDNRVIETLHLLRREEGLPEYDTVIGYFAEGEPIYEGAELRHQNHLQICVRNPERILGCFYPRSGTGG
jgi:hypothetical protein